MTLARKTLIFLICLLAIFAFRIPARAQNEATSDSNSPIILETEKIIEGQQINILVKGLVKPNNDVLIYINGVYDGLANISQGNAYFSLFNYLSSNIKDPNNTEILAIARDLNSHLLSSPTQAPVNSIIEKTVLTKPGPKETITKTNSLISAPTLKTPNEKNCVNKVYISGFSKNQTTVKIFIDNKLFAKILAISKVAETAFFSYATTVSFDRGEHSVYTIATDANGNNSPKSNILSFCIATPKITSTSSPEAIDYIYDLNTSWQNNDENLVFQKTNPQNASSSAESKNSNSKINLILFGIFVLLIIAWVVFVNKELLEDKNDLETKE